MARDNRRLLDRLDRMPAKSAKAVIEDYFKHNPSLAARGIRPDQVTITSLPDSANDTPLDGDMYVNGQCCRTVGEYKAAVEATCQKDAYR